MSDDDSTSLGNGAPATPPPPPSERPPSERPPSEPPPVPAGDVAAAPPPPPPADATGGTPAPKPARTSVNVSVDNPTALVLGLVAVVCVVLGLVLKGDTDSTSPTTNADSFWNQMGWTWAILAIVAAAVTLLPAVRKSVGLSRSQTTSIVAVAAGVLALEWVLFVLPQIASNRAFLITLGVLAAGGAAWLCHTQSGDD